MINLLQLIPVYIHLIKNLKIFIFKMLYLKYCYFFTKVKSINILDFIIFILDFIIFIFNLFHNFLQVIGTLKTLIELWLPFSLYIYAAEILRFSSYYYITRNIEYQTFFKYRRFHIFTFIFGNKDSFVFYHILFTPFLFNKDILKILR